MLTSLNSNVYKSIFKQYPIETYFTKFIHRAYTKTFLTRGPNIKHCFGHHDIYDKNKLTTYRRYYKQFKVFHMKFFTQNFQYIIDSPHAKSSNYIYMDNKTEIITVNQTLFKQVLVDFNDFNNK